MVMWCGQDIYIFLGVVYRRLSICRPIANAGVHREGRMPCWYNGSVVTSLLLVYWCATY